MYYNQELYLTLYLAYLLALWMEILIFNLINTEYMTNLSQLPGQNLCIAMYSLFIRLMFNTVQCMQLTTTEHYGLLL